MMTAIRVGEDRLSGQDVFLPLESRMQGLYVIGKQGMGKSNFLLTQIAQDLAAGYGVCVLDPHGDLIIDTLALVPAHREHDVVLLDLQDTTHPFAFDLFAGVDPSDPSSLASGEERVVGIFKKVWGDSSWGPRLEDLLANSVHTLLSNPGTTLADLPKLLTDAAYRQRLVNNVAIPIVREYWLIEYDALSPRGQAGVYAPLMNKLRAFLRHPVLSRIVSQSGTTVDFGQVLAGSQVLLVRLNAELEEATSLIGTAVVLRLLEAALGRKNVAADRRPPFLLYADEFQRFATPTFGKLLEEARKYAVGTTLAHQHRAQLTTSYLQSAVKGAINLVCFQLQYDDAREMAREFSPRQPNFLPSKTSELWKFFAKHDDETVRDLFREICMAGVLIFFEPEDDEEFRAIKYYGQQPRVVLAYVVQRLRKAIVNQDKKSPIFERDVDIWYRDEQMTKLEESYYQLRDRFIAITSYSPDTLVDLPRGQAAAKLLLHDGIHQHLLRFPQAVNKEHSTTVHAMLRHDRVSVDSLPFKPSIDFLEAGAQARRIRERNRKRYGHQTSPRPVSPLPTSPPPQPSRHRLPVAAEVEIDDGW